MGRYEGAGCQPETTEGKQTYDVGLYDVKLSGEVVTHPHLRVMSFRSDHWLKMASAFLRALLPATSDSLGLTNFPDSAALALFDGG